RFAHFQRHDFRQFFLVFQHQLVQLFQVSRPFVSSQFGPGLKSGIGCLNCCLCFCFTAPRNRSNHFPVCRVYDFHFFQVFANPLAVNVQQILSHFSTSFSPSCSERVFFLYCRQTTFTKIIFLANSSVKSIVYFLNILNKTCPLSG